MTNHELCLLHALLQTAVNGSNLEHNFSQAAMDLKLEVSEITEQKNKLRLKQQALSKLSRPEVTQFCLTTIWKLLKNEETANAVANKNDRPKDTRPH